MADHYCTAGDVRAALTPGGTEATDEQQSAASLPDWQIEDAILEAEGVINSYLTGYTLPVALIEFTEPNLEEPPVDVVFNAAPDPVRRWTRSIAAYLATLTFRIGRDIEEDDPVRLRYNMVLGLLQDVRAGLLVLDPDLFPPAVGTGDGVAIYNLYEGTLFGPDDFNLGPDGNNVQRIWPASTEFAGPGGF